MLITFYGFLVTFFSQLIGMTFCSDSADFIPPDYSGDIPPPPVAEDGKHHVNISVQFVNLMEVNEIEGFIQFSCFFRVFWIDSRLRLQNVSRYAPVRIPQEVAERLWRPSIVTEGVRQAVRNGIMKPTIYNGRFWGQLMFVSNFLSMRVGCSFQYQNYPFDVQMCKLHFTNIGMTTSDISLDWNKPSYTMDRNTFLRFQDRYQLRLCEDRADPVRHAKLGSHPQKTLFMVLERNYITYVVHLLFPSILVGLVAWLSILIPPTMLRTRLLLNSSNLLTILTVFVAISHAEASYIPKISYLTALSLWMYVCVAFVFSSMLIVIFDIRLIAILTQPRQQQQRVQKFVLDYYQRRRSTRRGTRLPSGSSLLEQVEADSAAATAAASLRRRHDTAAVEDEDGDVFDDASSRPVGPPGAADPAEARELEERLSRRRHLWLELTEFYEQIYVTVFPTLFCIFLIAFFWFYLRQRRLKLEWLEGIVRTSDGDQSGCWCTEHDDWAGCMTKEQYDE